MTDRLQRITLDASAADGESLVLCLQAVLRAFCRGVDYDELACVSGTAFMISFAPQAEPPARWNVYGRHAFLEPAARLYGLELRDLHPPDAAPTPPAPPEFDWHFRDSYLPFIETAVLRDEPVLAWMGWPPPCQYEWGLITRVDPCSRRCVGVTRASPIAEPAASPVQVYTITGYAPREPTADELARATLAHALIILSGAVDSAYGVVTGPAALRMICETPETFPRPGALVAAALIQLSSAQRFLSRIRPALGFVEARSVERVLALLRDTDGGLGSGSIDALIQMHLRLAAALTDQ